MKLAEIKKLFNLYSGEDPEEYLPIIRAAQRQVESALRPGADKEDVRLAGLCAVTAYYYYVKVSAARDMERLTLSGESPAAVDVTYRIKAAKSAAEQAAADCAEFIVDRDFCFIGTKG